MLAKLISHGATRDAAIARMLSALEALGVDGVKTNRDFLAACLRDPGFARGDVHTGFIDQAGDTLLTPMERIVS